MKHLKDIELLTPLGRKYREDPEYRAKYLDKIKQKKYYEICDKSVCSVNFARHCRGKKHITFEKSRSKNTFEKSRSKNTFEKSRSKNTFEKSRSKNTFEKSRSKQ